MESRQLLSTIAEFPTRPPVPAPSSSRWPRRQPLVHRVHRQQDRDDQPDDPRHHRVPRRRQFPPRGDHGGPRRQPLVHRARRQQDRHDQPDDPRHHRVRHPDRAVPAPTGSRRAPTATSGSPRPASDKIGMINPTTHAITEFPIPTAECRPARDHGGPRRQPLVHRVQRRQDRDDQPDDPRHHRVPHPDRRIPAPTRSRRARRQPLVHRDRRQQDRDDQPDDPRHHRVRPSRPPAPSRSGITAGPDGNLWFTELDGNQIGTINPATARPSPSSPSPPPAPDPHGITAGPDGNLWFTETRRHEDRRPDAAAHPRRDGPAPRPRRAGAPFGLTVSVDYQSGAARHRLQRHGHPRPGHQPRRRHPRRHAHRRRQERRRHLLRPDARPGRQLPDHGLHRPG